MKEQETMHDIQKLNARLATLSRFLPMGQKDPFPSSSCFEEYLQQRMQPPKEDNMGSRMQTRFPTNQSTLGDCPLQTRPNLGEILLLCTIVIPEQEALYY